ncbi:hypothetical protein [Bizionia paragorgiae]|uniref:hypothetical protein n=1 Tax=Bizionia paragorgiae TaxID=283786 RepID=UPI003A8F13FC
MIIGIFIGAVDAIFAVIHAYFFSKALPSQVFTYVASGIFGAEAFNLGYAMVFWGILFHFTIAILWSLFFLNFIFPISFVRKNFISYGCLFGLVMYAVMNFIVVPLSNTPPINSKFIPTLAMVLIHILLGFFMAYLGKTHYPNGLSNNSNIK